MVNKAETPSTDGAAGKRRAQLRQSDMPSVKLSEALRVANAIRDNYGMKPATPVDVGVAIGIAPTSGSFRTLTGASIAFGLTSGGYNAAEIALTDLGRRAVAPTEDGDDVVAMREAFERPRVIKEFIAKYNGTKLPASAQVAKNVLHGMGVPLEATDRAYELLVDGLKEYGYLRDVNGSSFVQRPQGSFVPVSPASTETAEDETDDEEELVEVTGSETPTPPTPSSEKRPNAIFLGHGKNRKPLEQLIKILDEYGIPHKEAVMEANAGRPIPTKVADTMRQCGAAILIFTADEQFKDMDDQEIWRPSENVVHELGAASVLYDNRIIIFKEESVTLASNFSSIGYISFDKDKLSDKGIELFRELVNFKIVNITVGGSA
jgi:hypothetical protein